MINTYTMNTTYQKSNTNNLSIAYNITITKNISIAYNKIFTKISMWDMIEKHNDKIESNV